MSGHKHRLPKPPANPRPKTMRQHYRDIAADDPTEAHALAEMLGLLDELEDLNKEVRECFYKEIPEARPIDC